jgi:hypothetical protein
VKRDFSFKNMGFSIHSGGNLKGRGIIVVEGLRVQAIPDRSCLWRESTKGGWKAGRGPKNEQGDWSPLFLLARALVTGSNDDRIYAVGIAPFISTERALKAARSPEEFETLVGELVASFLSAGKFEEAQAVVVFARVAARSPNELPSEIRMLCSVIELISKHHRRCPFKFEVRAHLGKRLKPYQDEKAFRDLLKRAGFGWLPAGKSGPKRTN